MKLPIDIITPCEPVKKKPWTTDFMEGIRIICADNDLPVTFSYEVGDASSDPEKVIKCQEELLVWHEKRGQ